MVIRINIAFLPVRWHKPFLTSSTTSKITLPAGRGFRRPARLINQHPARNIDNKVRDDQPLVGQFNQYDVFVRRHTRLDPPAIPPITYDMDAPGMATANVLRGGDHWSISRNCPEFACTAKAAAWRSDNRGGEPSSTVLAVGIAVAVRVCAMVVDGRIAWTSLRTMLFEPATDLVISNVGLRRDELRTWSYLLQPSFPAFPLTLMWFFLRVAIPLLQLAHYHKRGKPSYFPMNILEYLRTGLASMFRAVDLHGLAVPKTRPT